MYLLSINQALPCGCSFVKYGHAEGSASLSFGMMCSNSQLTGAHPFLSLFIFFCYRLHLDCFLLSDLRIFF